MSISINNNETPSDASPSLRNRRISGVAAPEAAVEQEDLKKIKIATTDESDIVTDSAGEDSSSDVDAGYVVGNSDVDAGYVVGKRNGESVVKGEEGDDKSGKGDGALPAKYVYRASAPAHSRVKESPLSSAAIFKQKESLGREPTPLELHTRTHQHQADHQWVDEKAKKAHDDFVRARESRQSTGEGSSSGSAHISEYHTWSEIVGGRQKGRVYGLGSKGYAIEGSSSTSTFHDLSGAEESVSERVAALTREIEEMKMVQSREIKEMRKV